MCSAISIEEGRGQVKSEAWAGSAAQDLFGASDRR